MKHLVIISFTQDDGMSFSIKQVMTYQKIGSLVVYFTTQGAKEINVKIEKYNMNENEIKEFYNNPNV